MNKISSVGGFEIKQLDLNKEVETILNLWEKGREKSFSKFWKIFHEPYVSRGINTRVKFHEDGISLFCPDTIADDYDIFEDAYLEAVRMLRESVAKQGFDPFVAVFCKNSHVIVAATRDRKTVEPIADVVWRGGNIHIRMYSLSRNELDIILDFLRKVAERT